MKSLGKSAVPRQMQKELRKLGEDIRHARIRRNFTKDEFSMRIGISRNTLSNIENGAPTVAIGTIARALYILNITGTVGQMADLSNDPISRDLEIAKLPKRVTRK